MIGHRLMGTSLLVTGDIAESRTHFDQAIALYDPAAHRALATRFGQDLRVSVLSYRSFALWALGYPEAALADAERAIKDAREIGQAATLMYALFNTSFYIHVPAETTQQQTRISDELVALADEKGAFVLEGDRNGAARLRVGLNWQSLGRCPRDHIRNRPPAGQREQHCGCHCIFHTWRAPMRILGNSMTLGAASAKP